MPAGNTDRAHHDEPNEEQASGFKRGTKASAESSGRTRIRDLFHVPAPVKRVFDRFPVVTYPANPLPLHTSSTQSARDVPTLYIFVDREDAHLGKPSFNPGCLKWQTFLHFCNIEFQVVSSNNHASPSGALPFLLPSRSLSTFLPSGSTSPVPYNEIQKYVLQHYSPPEEPSDIKYEPFLSLIDYRIRNAWLYTLYLSPFHTSLSQRLYIDPTTTNTLVKLTLAHHLRIAASVELTKYSAVIDVAQIHKEAELAFEALATLLSGGDAEDSSKRWFFGAERPGLFDASVFAYTHLILHGDELGWWNGSDGQKLVQGVRRRDALVRHRERVLKEFYDNA